MTTGIVDMPIAISYEIICALDRSPPSSEYLLFDAQPASATPYAWPLATRSWPRSKRYSRRATESSAQSGSSSRPAKRS